MSQEEIAARRRALEVRIKTEGAEAAYEAALEVCRDKKAPAPARATCATTILRAGGYFASREDFSPKQLHEMTPEELDAEMAVLRGKRRDLNAGFPRMDFGEGDEDAPDTFG